MLKGPDVSVLQHVFRFRVAASNGAGGAIEPLVIAPHDHLEQTRVAGEHTLDYLLVGELLILCACIEYSLVHACFPALQLDESGRWKWLQNLACNLRPFHGSFEWRQQLWTVIFKPPGGPCGWPF